jgi:serine/threonine protein kinase
MHPVPKSHLEPLVLLGAGGFGKVHRTTYQLDPSDPRDLVYKEYTHPDPVLRARAGERAQRAVDFRDDLLQFGDAADLAVLDTYFAWPREVVRDDGTDEIVGFLMPLAGPEYFWRIRRQGGYETIPRTLDWVTTVEQVWQVNHVDLSQVTATDRLFLMAQLAYAIAWLHKQGWVFGDLSFPNVAFAMFPDPPRLFIFDCDDAAALDDPLRGEQPHTPFWFPPECQAVPPAKPAPQDTVTDAYKLGLAVVRCLKPGNGVVTTYDVDRLDDILDSEGLDLLDRALSDDRDRRPAARDIFAYLDRTATPRMVAPQIGSTDLVTPLVFRGGNARIYWQIDGAEEISVYLGDDRNRVRVARQDEPQDECGFLVPRSGQVTVLAVNRYGSAGRIVGDVSLLDLPEFDASTLTRARPAIPPVPSPPNGYPDPPVVPPVPPTDFADAYRHLAPGGDIVSPAEPINATLHASWSVLDLLRERNQRFVARRQRWDLRLAAWRRALAQWARTIPKRLAHRLVALWLRSAHRLAAWWRRRTSGNNDG